MKDLKYLAAFSLPLVAFIGLYFKGIYAFLTPVYAFVIIPVLELLLPVETSNLEEDEVKYKLSKKVFDWLLYFNLPVVFGLLIWSFFIVNTQALE
ncbi:MAG: alkane 1-monooxygenase, partial [Olleya sp.]